MIHIQSSSKPHWHAFKILIHTDSKYLSSPPLLQSLPKSPLPYVYFLIELPALPHSTTPEARTHFCSNPSSSLSPQNPNQSPWSPKQSASVTQLTPLCPPSFCSPYKGLCFISIMPSVFSPQGFALISFPWNALVLGHIHNWLFSLSSDLGSKVTLSELYQSI